jgi:hypothetical protein
MPNLKYESFTFGTYPFRATAFVQCLKSNVQCPTQFIQIYFGLWTLDVGLVLT